MTQIGSFGLILCSEICYHTGVSMCGGLWKLWLGGIKNLAPSFAAFDRPHYQKLIPRYLCDIFLNARRCSSFL